MIKDLKKGSRTTKEKEKTIVIDEVGETLKPLNCSHCGGVLASGEAVGKCQHCGKLSDMPQHYSVTMQQRWVHERLMARALLYQKKFQFMTHPAFNKLLLLLGLWIIAALFILALMPIPVRVYCFPFVKSYALLNMLPGTFALFAIVTAAILFLLRINFDRKTVAKIPVKTFDELVVASDQTIGCNNCGAPIHFHKLEIGHICLYCGTECYRVNFAYKLAQNQTSLGREGRVSLINAMKDVEKSADNMMVILGLASGAVVVTALGVIIYNIVDIIETLF
jgi:hypothetical protein